MMMGGRDQESRLPFNRDEGPYGLIICPSRELAKQIFEIIEHFTKVTGQPFSYLCHCFTFKVE
jgi:ATP-dependent RNA helicase DDX41